MLTAQETQERIAQGLKSMHDLRQHFMELADSIEVLVVDDSADFCHMVSQYIESLLDRRCNVYRATSGREALGILSSRKIDILLLDLRMPEGGGNGVDVLRSISNRDAKMVVILVTGIVGDSPEIKEAASLGYTTIIDKSELWDGLRVVFGITCAGCPTKP